MISQRIMTGGGRLLAFTCVDGQGEILMPCGRCRQLLSDPGTGHEAADRQRIRTMDEVLPDAFGPQHLEGQAGK